MKIIEVTSFEVKFNLKIGTLEHKKIADQFNYGGGSLYQKFRVLANPSILEDLKNLKNVDFFVPTSYEGHLKFVLITEELEQAKVFSKTIGSLLKSILEDDSPIFVEIDKNMIVSDTVLSFNL